ncbi:MAG TPA: HTH domain-containing protein, partial [Sedimentisphaerales bacterium]
EYITGKSPRAILEGMDISPETIGESRIVSIRMHAVEQGRKGSGFTDRKKQWSPEAIHGRAKTTEDKIARLEHELAYTRQELEFVKKIILADREAQREWHSKQRREKNSESSGE